MRRKKITSGTKGARGANVRMKKQIGDKKTSSKKNHRRGDETN